MSFICCDARNPRNCHKVTGSSITPTIDDYFESRYSKAEHECVQSVIVDLNAQYQSFYLPFPNANIIIDQLHLVQSVGRAFGQLYLYPKAT